jgi:hypothetical protein
MWPPPMSPLMATIKPSFSAQIGEGWTASASPLLNQSSSPVFGS